MIEYLKNRGIQQYDWPIFKVVPVIVVEYHVDPDLKNPTSIDQEPTGAYIGPKQNTKDTDEQKTSVTFLAISIVSQSVIKL